MYSGSCNCYSHLKNDSRGYCWGTKDMEVCTCGGDKTKCDFYPDVKLKAQKEKIESSLDWKINKAIELLIKNGYEVKKI